MNKKITTTLIILILLVVAVFVYVSNDKNTAVPELVQGAQEQKYEELTFPNNTLDTSGWQTYQNEEFGFEVRYPRDWEVLWGVDKNPHPLNPTAWAYILPKDRTDPNDDRGAFIYLNSKDFLGQLNKLNQRSWLVKKKIQINNTKGVIVDRQDESGSWLYYDDYMIEGDGVYYTFIESGDDYTSIFQQILLSFNFVK